MFAVFDSTAQARRRDQEGGIAPQACNCAASLQFVSGIAAKQYELLGRQGHFPRAGEKRAAASRHTGRFRRSRLGNSSQACDCSPSLKTLAFALKSAKNFSISCQTSVPPPKPFQCVRISPTSL